MTPAMSMPPVVTDKDGMRVCALVSCGTRFIPPTVRTRFCPDHRGYKNLSRDIARNRRVAESYKKICNVCGDSFTATDKRQERCQACLTIDVVTCGSGGLRFDPRKVTAGGRISGQVPPDSDDLADTIICAFISCGTRFIPRTYRTHFCPDHAGYKKGTPNASRNRRAAQSRKRACNVCGETFTAGGQTLALLEALCQACVTAGKSLPGSDRDTTRVIPRDVASAGKSS